MNNSKFIPLIALFASCLSACGTTAYNFTISPEILAFAKKSCELVAMETSVTIERQTNLFGQQSSSIEQYDYRLKYYSWQTVRGDGTKSVHLHYIEGNYYYDYDLIFSNDNVECRGYRSDAQFSSYFRENRIKTYTDNVLYLIDFYHENEKVYDVSNYIFSNMTESSLEIIELTTNEYFKYENNLLVERSYEGEGSSSETKFYYQCLDINYYKEFTADCDLF